MLQRETQSHFVENFGHWRHQKASFIWPTSSLFREDEIWEANMIDQRMVLRTLHTTNSRDLSHDCYHVTRADWAYLSLTNGW